MKVYKRYCNNCKKYYEGYGCFYCSNKCNGEVMVGENNPFYGKKHTEETKKKISEVSLKREWNHHTEESKVKMRKNHSDTSGKNNPMYGRDRSGYNNPMYGRHHSEKTLQKLRGANSYFWKGGITEVRDRIRNSLKYKMWRSECRINDSYTCLMCGQVGGILHVDHYKITFSQMIRHLIKLVGIENVYEKAMMFQPLWDTNNGRTLCIDCHKKTPNYLNGFKKLGTAIID